MAENVYSRMYVCKNKRMLDDLFEYAVDYLGLDADIESNDTIIIFGMCDEDIEDINNYLIKKGYRRSKGYKDDKR